MIYNGKPISENSLWDLGIIEKSLNEAIAKRDKASKHPKFDKMEFPPVNPEFLKLKEAIEVEIRKKQNANISA